MGRRIGVGSHRAEPAAWLEPGSSHSGYQTDGFDLCTSHFHSAVAREQNK